MQMIAIHVDEPNCRKYGQQKEMADHFLFDFEALWQVKIHFVCFLSKENSIFQENYHGSSLN